MKFRSVVFASVWSLLAAAPVAAQATGLGSQSMRPYRYVFFAYALAWILVLAWAFSLSRRLARVERMMESDPS